MDAWAALRDGYSTAGTSGTGLGAIQRLADTFDVWSAAGGSVILARFDGAKASGVLAWGGASAPKAGEPRCGDAWDIREADGVTAVLVADGLGHGAFAADASSEAVSVFRTAAWRGPGAMIADLHAALRSTRGAAVAVTAIEARARRVTFCGLGNIAASLIGGGRTQNMVSMNGTAGHQAARIREFEYAWPQSGHLVMHSDGIATSWNLERYPGLLRHHPAIIAGILYRDFSRGRDDATAVAVAEDQG
jgi:hypothetical protein